MVLFGSFKCVVQRYMLLLTLHLLKFQYCFYFHCNVILFSYVLFYYWLFRLIRKCLHAIKVICWIFRKVRRLEQLKGRLLLLCQIEILLLILNISLLKTTVWLKRSSKSVLFLLLLMFLKDTMSWNFRLRKLCVELCSPTGTLAFYNDDI